MRARILVAVLVILGAPAFGAAAQSAPSGATLAIPRVSQAPTLADVAADRWPAAGRVEGLRQRSPGDGVPVSQRTTAYLSYDDTRFYVGFRCHEDAGELRARMAKREDIADDDQVAVYLDTFHSRQRAYVFAASPLGIQQDGILPEGEDPDYTFDAVWQADAKLTSDGFAVLMAIPFSSLRFAGSGPQSWGLALGRSEPRNNEQAFWPYVTSRVEGFTNQMATVTLEGVSPGRNLLFIPYAAFTGSRFLDAADPAFVRATEPRVGLDAKVVLRDAFTLDATVNPDFSQVESDEPQVTINRRFEVFFPEKRPFFIENVDYFSTPDDLFFSRRVRDPRIGARLTGKIGRWTLGAIGADDRAADPEADTDATGRTGIGAFRLQREFGEQSRVALFATDRQGPSGSNQVVSADTRLKLTPTWVFTGLAARSRSAATGGLTVTGTDAYGEIARSGRSFNYSGSYLDRSPNFEAQLGFIERVDLRETDHVISYAWHPEHRRLLAIEPVFTGSVDWNYQRRRQDWYAEPGVNLSFAGSLDVQLARTEYDEVIEGLPFRQHSSSVSIQDAHVPWLVVGGSFSRGAGVNYHPPEGTASFLADATDASVTLTWRPARRLRVGGIYYFSQLAVPPGAAGGPPAGRVFDDHIARATVNYQFTRRLSLRTIVDYEGLLSNPLLEARPVSTRLAGDVLLTYLVDPFTAIYAGYTDQFENVALTTDAPPVLRTIRSPTTSTGRQAFVKLSFGIRF